MGPDGLYEAPHLHCWQVLLLGKKAMTYLDSILKGRDITFPTTVRLVKAIIFQ